jgi:hypothetical protein
MTTKYAIRYDTEEERKEAKREAVRRYRAKKALESKGGCKCIIHLEEELKTTRELYQAQSDKIQELEKRLEVVVSAFNLLEKNCVVEEQLKEVMLGLGIRLGILEARGGKLPPRITK